MFPTIDQDKRYLFWTTLVKLKINVYILKIRGIATIYHWLRLAWFRGRLTSPSFLRDISMTCWLLGIAKASVVSLLVSRYDVSVCLQCLGNIIFLIILALDIHPIHPPLYPPLNYKSGKKCKILAGISTYSVKANKRFQNVLRKKRKNHSPIFLRLVNYAINHAWRTSLRHATHIRTAQ